MKTTTTRERPILFSGPMVRAILAGTKTQTRRVIKPQPHPSCSEGGCGWHWHPRGREDHYLWNDNLPGLLGMMSEMCPYGDSRFADRLWVRETWRCNHFGGLRIEYKAGGTCLEYDRWPKGAIPPYSLPTSPMQVRRTERQLGGEKIPDAWRPSIHMPRWASRITLEITEVRVERLQDISEEDAIAEGVGPGYVPNAQGLTTCVGHRPMFIRLWNELNAKRGYGWAVNPWAWVVSFCRMEAMP